MSIADRTAADHAFVTLITSDDYLPGALAQSAALNDLHPTRRGGPFPKTDELEEEAESVPFTTICLVTPETVSIETIKQLRRTFDLVIGVEVIEGDKNSEEIRLLGRPDLHQTFTKLHVLRLAQFASVVFLDADVLPLRPLSHLLNLVSSWPDEYFHGDDGDTTPTATAPGITSSGPAPFLTETSKLGRNPHRLRNPIFPCPVSAAPDSGWPDIFNSGVIVLAPPGERGFKEAMGVRSWDGGDQGTLNEWAGRQAGLTGQGTGGPGWNRLSFKYNVTPTAAYTYAPAYAKYGTAIHAVHFIGLGKPWSSLSFRPPFISSSGRSAGKYVIGAYGSPGSTDEAKETAYGYHALVDRWYAVYDAHYRVDESDDKNEFELQHYESAWKDSKKEDFTAYDGGADTGTQTAATQANQYPHVVPPYTYHVAAYSVLTGLAPSSAVAATLEELRRLAIQGIGRADGARAGVGAYISLPLEGRVSLMRPPRPELVFHHPKPEAHRSASPPIIAWNPALEPPPSHPPANTQWFPEGSYVQNQWDMPHHDSSQFFTPPPPVEYIPRQLIEEGHYSALTVHGFRPDQSQVKSVFPWEETTRTAPKRIFPGNAPPAPPVPAPAASRVFPPEQPGSTPHEIGTVYSNAWDEIPSIQRYASRLMGVNTPPAQATPSPAPESSKPEKEWSWERNRGEADASSRDGDDEDDEDENDEDGKDQKEAKAKALAGVVGGQEPTAVSNGSSGVSRPKLGSRSGSRSASGSGSRSASVSKTTNATTPAAQTLRLSQSISMSDRNGSALLKGYGAYLAEKRKAQGALEGRMDVARVARFGAGTPALMYPLGIEPQLPGLIWAPAPDARTDDEASPPSLAEPSFEFARRPRLTLPGMTSLSVAGTLGSTLDVLSHTRTISSENDLTDDSSLPPSPGASPPSDLERGPPPAPARTFDDARSVDAFKRDSHEILARFLRMGSWGSETP